MKKHNMNTMSWRKTIGYGAFLLIVMTSGFAHGQGNVISLSGPVVPLNAASAFSDSLGVNNRLLGISWTATGAFSNVNISILLDGNSGAIGVAYLTRRIGSGTTPANQIASASFAFPSTSSLTPVLSGLNLGDGTYYLIIQQTANGSNGDGVWLGTSSPTVTSAANVTANGEYWYSGSFRSYAPASAFGRGSITYFEYAVTSVPEPSAAWLILLGNGVAVCVRKSSRHSAKKSLLG